MAKAEEPALPVAGLLVGADEGVGFGGLPGEAADGRAHRRVGGAGDQAGGEPGGQLLGTKDVRKDNLA